MKSQPLGCGGSLLASTAMFWQISGQPGATFPDQAQNQSSVRCCHSLCSPWHEKAWKPSPCPPLQSALFQVYPVFLWSSAIAGHYGQLSVFLKMAFAPEFPPPARYPGPGCSHCPISSCWDQSWLGRKDGPPCQLCSAHSTIHCSFPMSPYPTCNFSFSCV